jgi:hypothetical protein
MYVVKLANWEGVVWTKKKELLISELISHCVICKRRVFTFITLNGIQLAVNICDTCIDMFMNGSSTLEHSLPRLATQKRKQQFICSKTDIAKPHSSLLIAWTGELNEIYLLSFFSVPLTCGALAVWFGKLSMDHFLSRLHWRTWEM